ncbi:helix-turn-helix domain-containing protein [Candidatus Nitrospira bockiana]
MPIGRFIQAWRVSRGQSLSALAAHSGVSLETLEAIERDETDPSLSTVEALAKAFGIPASWLYADPRHLELLAEEDGDETDGSSPPGVDPVIERILTAAHQERELFALLTRLLQSGDPKLIRAAEVSLRSLVKQSRQATVPWQSRPPGHFEPPSD